jgi:hypothetical protein
MVKNLTILVFAVLNQMGLRSKTKRFIVEHTCVQLRRLHVYRSIVEHTPRVPTRKGEGGLILEFHVFLAELISCNPTPGI